MGVWGWECGDGSVGMDVDTNGCSNAATNRCNGDATKRDIGRGYDDEGYREGIQREMQPR